ncbi:glutamyl-tRNA(Gln) amidotransferase subunit C, mitochondrial [Stomoxys calcitrans]|uniref:Glutamyl-tRNA(Gln) amidotransferase subunit C, mitochondrial n=1 Tax=Stomoxys calcitrans TaxID=35570 RepID=A0A1I8PML5_STOCA|nr:glutamyl-tRNA(Gln) amidotransferase subunit C, mitochondrial [Stomoxys calcitrans]
MICRGFLRKFCVAASARAVVREKLDYKKLKYASKIPNSPHVSANENDHPPVPITSKTFLLLERLSLVDIDGDEAQKTVEKSVQFAEKITNINTSNIQPLYMVLYEQPLRLRKDEISEGNCREDILQNASVTDEDYFISPPGNIPLNQENSSQQQ